jgi:nucleotide-binding universal stress UspA family protein
MSVILVATDGSAAADAALAESISLASVSGDEIVAITVWRALQGDFGVAHPSIGPLDDILDRERNHAEAALRDAIHRAEAVGVPVRTRLAAGDPAEQICSYAREIGARLIAIGTRGHAVVTALVLGSVSDAVIRNAPCPVLVVHATATDAPVYVDSLTAIGIAHDADRSTFHEALSVNNDKGVHS